MTDEGFAMFHLPQETECPYFLVPIFDCTAMVENHVAQGDREWAMRMVDEYAIPQEWCLGF